LLIVAYLACDYGNIAARVASLGLSPALLLYIGLYAFLTVAIFFAAAIPNFFGRLLFVALFCPASIYVQAVEWVTHNFVTYDIFITHFNSRESTSDAFILYGDALKLIIPINLLLAAGVLLPPGRARVPFMGWVASAAPLVALTLFSVILYNRGGEGGRALPAGFLPLSYGSLMGYEELTTPHGRRNQVTLPLTPDKDTRDIVLLIDESVVGNYLDVNNPAGVPTGLANPPAGWSVVNYGYAASVHNCSINTNAVLRFGGTRDTYQETLRHYPSIWRYATKAGYRTVYIDAQTTGGHLMDLMTIAERAEIDDFVQFDHTAVIDRDMAVADALAARINNGRRELIYVNKMGAHFPVQDKFPDRLARYRPILDRGTHDNIIWSSDRTGFHGTPPEWVRYRNSYRNTLLWTVSAFFQRLFHEADSRNAIIIYTSDHGQDLHEQGNPGANTHCGTGKPHPQEGLVPLMVMEASDRPSRDWRKTLAANHNGLSHFRIFPTALALMGYDEAAARPLYGATLDAPDKDDFSFNTLFNTRLGKSPEWQRIDLSKINTPPVSDYAPASAGPVTPPSRHGA
jgi:hypothetical protein